ncbi:hypothetical protein C8Q74DRAFT_1302652 [Fomes fomentarius]|nr:hypothetical protein C8Q74DRAFT_1302652 [Fomes fomentarius]
MALGDGLAHPKTVSRTVLWLLASSLISLPSIVHDMAVWSSYEDSQDDYEPSQTLPQIYPAMRNRSRPPRRARASAAEQAVSRYYEAGGLLDSQTSDSQFAQALLQVASSDNVPQYVEAATQTDNIPDVAQPRTSDHEHEDLSAELLQLRMAYNIAMARLEAIQSLANEELCMLDCEEASQVEVGLPVCWSDVAQSADVAEPGSTDLAGLDMTRRGKRRSDLGGDWVDVSGSARASKNIRLSL